MQNPKAKLSLLLKEYARIAQKAAHAFEKKEDHTIYEPGLQQIVDSILALKNAS